MDYNQIKSFINLEIIGEEDKNKNYLFIYLLNTISIFYLKKSSMYGKLISTQFFYQLRFFYQLLNYNNLDYNQIKIFIKLEIIGEEDKKKKLYLFLKKI